MPPTEIDTQPTNQLDIPIGQDAMFSVAASGDSLTYQWQKDETDIMDNADYSGTTTDTLTVLSVEVADEGLYRCVVTGSGGSVTSNTAQLTVGELSHNILPNTRIRCGIHTTYHLNTLVINFSMV